MMDTENDSPYPLAARASRIAPGIATALLAMMFALPVEAARLALVVGNDTYQRAPTLRNARNDANSMEVELRAAGFVVTKVLDADRSALLRAKDDFAKRVKSDDDVVFFFSGHGSQPERYGAYLLPTDIAPTDERQITRDGLALEEVISDLKHARFSLIIIDACRDDPFRALSNKRSAIAGSQIAMGDPPRGTAVLLSASTGQQALDRLSNSDPVRNGLFTRELLKVMRTPGLDISSMLRKVRNEVETTAKRVKHVQRPSLRDETSGEFYFYPGTKQESEVAAELDQFACEAARSRSTAAAWQVYLRSFPSGRCAAEGRDAIVSIGNRSDAQSVSSPPKPGPPGAAVSTSASGKNVDKSLGRLHVASAVGEPLRATVDISRSAYSDIKSVRFNVASEADYRSAKVEYPKFASMLQASVRVSAAGHLIGVVESAKAMDDVYVDLLVELKSDLGRVVREYVFLLDPPPKAKQ